MTTVTSDPVPWPPGFLWGVSTSGHQYDGNNVASDYWALEHLDVPLFTEPSGDALNSYHLWPRDMALAAELGFTAYRFGIEWARIEPARGCFSVAERDRYTQMKEDRFLRVCRDDDWLGVQSYTSHRIGPDGPVEPRPDHELTQMGWEFRPDALGTSVRRATSVAPGVPIIVTENGIPTADDTRRVAFIDGALEALRAALTDGVDVRGYCHWTFIDNFEWTLGYAPTFGLVAVDRRTFTRTPKPSVHHLGAIARQASTGTGVRG
jgi:beta-glucosidase/6-phospho-beta-glucosidase/beta-galactosidase